MCSQKNKIKYVFILLLVLISFSFVSPAEDAVVETGDPVQFVSSPELNMTGLQISRLKQSSGGYSIGFRGDEALLEVNGDKFENIKYNSNRPGTITVSSTGSITYAKFTTNENGGEYTIGGTTFEAPPNSDVFYDRKSGKIVVTSNQDSVIKSEPFFPECGEDAFRCPGKKIEFYAKEGTITLPGGHVLESGKIIKGVNGDYYIGPKEKIIINGVEVETYDKNKIYSLFFDEEGSGEAYVSFSKDEVSGKMIGGILINFNENNPYAKIEEGDFLKISGTNGEFKLESHSDAGKIPTLDLYGSARVWNDGKFLEYDHNSKKTLFSRGSTYQMNKIKKTTSTPMEISFFDLDRKPVLESTKTKNEYSILFDNFNRFAVIPKKAGDEFYIESEGVDTKFSSRLRYNYVNEKELQILTGNKIKFEGGRKKLEDSIPAGEKSLLLGRVRGYYDTLTQESKDSLKTLYLTNTKELRMKARYSALYDKIDGDVYISTDMMDLPSFRHEMAHSVEYPMSRSSGFKKAWKEIYASEESNLVYKGTAWKQLKLKDFPAEGVLRPYSYQDESEHIATYLEPLSANPAFFKNLVNPKSPEYSPKYMESINLLYEYKFISKRERDAVLREAGLL